MPAAEPVEAALRPSTKLPGHRYGLPAAPMPTAPGVRTRLTKPMWEKGL